MYETGVLPFRVSESFSKTLFPLHYFVSLSLPEDDEEQQYRRLHAALCQKQVLITKNGRERVKNRQRSGEIWER